MLSKKLKRKTPREKQRSQWEQQVRKYFTQTEGRIWDADEELLGD
jgi:hypothetical protein